MKASSVSAAWACPNCRTPLQDIPGARVGVMACARCNGRAVSLNLLRATSKPEAIDNLWRQAKAQNRPVGKPCPACRRPSLEALVGSTSQQIVLDLCAGCLLVWFDFRELEELQKSAGLSPNAEGLRANTLDRAVDEADLVYWIYDLFYLFRR